MSISVKIIENPDCMLLIEIANILNIQKLQLNYYETIFEVKLDNTLIAIINYKCISSRTKNRLYIRNIHYSNIIYLDTIIKELCGYFKNYILETNIDDENISDECIRVMRNNNFEGHKDIFYGLVI
jgi:hypothetical protein